MFAFGKRRRRARIAAQPFPEEWRRILRRRVPYYDLLGEDDRRRFEAVVQILLAEKHFEGCEGFEITDEVRVTIAGHASVLILHLRGDYYPALQTILVYPEAFQVPLEEEGPDGVVSIDPDERAGESWDRGAVILAWEEVLLSGEDGEDGYNVVLHEFAHQLDFAHRMPQQDATFGAVTQFEDWSDLFETAYQQFVKDVDRNRRTLLDDYAATNQAEFFAVATETFFERPIAMERRHPEIYAALRTYYAQDPAALVRQHREMPSKR